MLESLATTWSVVTVAAVAAAACCPDVAFGDCSSNFEETAAELGAETTGFGVDVFTTVFTWAG